METLAADYLMSQGYVILHRNYRCRLGEIDLIAKDGKSLCFIEVKYRSSNEVGFPEEAVNLRKQKKIIDVARFYLMKECGIMDVECRFDVISIAKGKLQLYKNAFYAAY